jgi:hypothetical protein
MTLSITIHSIVILSSNGTKHNHI